MKYSLFFRWDCGIEFEENICVLDIVFLGNIVFVKYYLVLLNIF